MCIFKECQWDLTFFLDSSLSILFSGTWSTQMIWSICFQLLVPPLSVMMTVSKSDKHKVWLLCTLMYCRLLVSPVNCYDTERWQTWSLGFLEVTQTKCQRIAIHRILALLLETWMVDYRYKISTKSYTLDGHECKLAFYYAPKWPSSLTLCTWKQCCLGVQCLKHDI